MRKRLITPSPAIGPPPDDDCLDLDRVASVDVTSEEKDYGIEGALVSEEKRGWRAADSGTQTIRLLFDEPQRLRRISLLFEEDKLKRTQEFVLRCFFGWRTFVSRNSCASNGISARPRQIARARNFKLISRRL